MGSGSAKNRMTQEIRAAVCRGRGAPLTIETLELADLEADWVRVRIKAAAICYSDVSYIDGVWGGNLPAVYGHEASGVVEEAGEGVDAVKPSDPVAVTLVRSCGHCTFCSRGEETLCSTDLSPAPSAALRTLDGESVVQGMGTAAFATQVVVHQSQLVPLPIAMPFDEAALLACAAITGVGAVIHESGCRPGDSLAVIGIGGVGLNSIQGAVWAGAANIIAIDGQQTKLKKAMDFGATQVVDAGSGDVVETVRSLGGGREWIESSSPWGRSPQLNRVLICCGPAAPWCLLVWPLWSRRRVFPQSILSALLLRCVAVKWRAVASVSTSSGWLNDTAAANSSWPR